MSKAIVTANFIAPLLRHFNQPEMETDEDVRLFFSDIIEDLSQYPAEVLALAAKKVRRSRMSLTFPPLAECLAACREAHGEVIKPPERRASVDHPEWSDVRKAAANRMICCPMGLQAAKQGWIVWLWDWCREHNGLPNRNEAQGIIAKFREAEMYYQETELPPAFLNARSTILSRREELSKFVMERSHGGSQHIQPKSMPEAGDFHGDRREADAPRY
jgi:hypothetical protein